MRSSSLLFAAASLVAGAAAQAKWASPQAIAEMERSYNCDCHCDCEIKSEHPCNVDYFILLDAASCVRNAWMEMLNRVRNVAKTIDDSGRPLGRETRFAVMRYAEQAQYDMKFNENLNYRQFSKRLSRLETYNEGSYLSRGWAAMSEVVADYQADRANNGRRLIVIVVTNGISHPGPTGSPKHAEIEKLNNALMGPWSGSGKNTNYGLFVNTIIQKKNEFAQADECFACKWNEEMFRGGNLDVDSQVFSKHRLEERLLSHIKTNVCLREPSAKQVCNNCECSCDVPAGPQGPPGPPGEPGRPGQSSPPGMPGRDGEDGGCGVPGPNGAPGCDAEHGNPGHHGRPGPDGNDGQPGNQGKEGPEGPAGRAARQSKPDNGPQGEPGNPGEVGPTGKNGRQGQPGNRGPSGQSGPLGKAGKNGESGEPGRHGRAGNPGEAGPVGYPGADGSRGARGDRGNKGPRGVQGDAGAQGPQGADGPPGMPGLCGSHGDKGVVGMRGPSGPAGIMGDNVDESYVRNQVRQMLDRLLPKERDARFCKCKAYSLYNVITKSINF